MDIPIQLSWHRRHWSPGFFPHRFSDQHFGEHLPDSEFFSPFHTMFYYRPYFWRFPNSWDTGMSEVRSDRDRFVINLDVKHFTPEELTVKVNDDYIAIRGKHDERQDEHGIVVIEFYRKYKIPAGVDPSAFTSSLSSDGVLTICVPSPPVGDH